MPLQRCIADGKPAWRYGESGKPYPYDPDDSESEKMAKKKAIDQGLAIGDGELKKAAVELILKEIENKSEPGPCSKALNVEIAKVADNVVYGIVLRADTEDLQGDVMSKEDIAKACHDYMEDYRAINVGHKDDVDACPVECWIAKEPGVLGKRKYGAGDWLMGTKINDPETLAKVNTGLLKSYSIEGEGVRVPL
jgi:hypothetical protein